MIATTAISGGLTPYRGLTQYTEEDAPFFFGREDETRLIASNLLASRLTLLYGATGVGKSSLLAAGVKRHLDDRARATLAGRAVPEWVTVVFPSDRIAIGPRRDSWREDPLDALAAAIEDSVAALGADVAPPPRAPDLVTLLNAWTETLDAEIMLILDQFEEFFLYHGDEDGEGTLAADLPRVLAKPGGGVNVLLSIREDAYAQLDRFKGRIPALYDNYLRLDHLTPERARVAITGPIDEYNRRGGDVRIEDELVDAVLEQVQSGAVVLGQTGRGTVESGERRGIETPFLQLVMERLWLRETELGSRTLRLETLEDLGGAKSIVRTHLDSALDGFSAAEREAAAAAFGRLVTPSGTKIASLASDLAASEELPLERVEPVLERLADLRVLRTIAPVTGEQQPRYEIFHDVLAPAVLDWRARWSQDAQRRRLERDLAEQQSRARRFRFVASVVALLAALALAAALIALDKTQDAKRGEQRANSAARDAKAATREARSNASLADAASRIGSDPANALKVAAAALTADHRDKTAAETLRAALRIPVPLAVFAPKGETVRGAAFSPDGAFTVTLSGRGIDVGGGYEGTRFGHRALDRTPRTVAISRDDRSILAGTDGAAVMWHWLEHGPATTLPVRGRVLAVGFAGKRAIAVSERGVYAWQDGRRVLTRRLRPHGATVAAISPRGDRAALGTNGGALLVDLRSGHVDRLRWRGSRVTVTRALTFSRDGRRLAMGSDLPLDEFGGTPGGVGVHARLGVWDAATGRPRTWSDGPRVGVTAVAFSPGSRRVAYGSADGVTRVWELGARGRGPAMRGHTGQITTVAYSRRGDLIVTGSGDGDARVWTQDGRPVAKLAGNGAWVVGATFSPDGRRLVTADEGAARLWQRPAGSSERLVSGVLATSQDGMRALARRRGALRIVGVDGGRTLATLHGAQAADAAFADGDRRVITAGYEGVTLWNAQTGARIVRRSGYSFAVDYGRGPYGVLTEHGVRRWDLETGRLERPLDRGHYFLPAISDDGRFVAAWSSERVVVWDTRTRKRVAVLRHQVPSAFQFSPDGRTLSITAYFDAGSARLWRPGGGAPLRLATHGRVDRVRFSPDGSLVATLGVESAVRIWDTSDGHRVAVLQGHRAAVRDAAFSRDGKRIATVSLDGTARLWNARDGSLVEQIWTRDSPVRVSLAGGDHRILLSGYSSLESYSCTLCGNLGELVQLAQQRAP